MTFEEFNQRCAEYFAPLWGKRVREIMEDIDGAERWLRTQQITPEENYNLLLSLERGNYGS